VEIEKLVSESLMEFETIGGLIKEQISKIG
jgi:hypothetical protein